MKYVALLFLIACGPAATQTPTSEPATSRVTQPPAEVVASYHLSDRYTKYLDAGGFPILATEHASDYGLYEAAYLIDKLLHDRADIRSALGANHIRFVVMATTEYTTDVPEHSDLGKEWNTRARGVGATEARPAVSCGEENLLELAGDPYAAENILIHEFSHAVHEMGMSKVDPSFDGRLQAAYDHAKAKGLWANTYAMQNHAEYFAEGVQSWFDTNRANDDDHGPIDTREKLKQYDPELAKLIIEVYGDGAWRYHRPSTRPAAERAHLEGLDRSAFQPFAYPE
jgi:hypothetical protein